MKLFLHKLKKRTVFLLLCALLLTATAGTVSAWADEGDIPEFDIPDLQMPESFDVEEPLEADALELETADMQEDETVDPEEAELFDLEEFEAIDLDGFDGNDADLDRLALAQCVFTIYDGQVYWMSLTEPELIACACYLQDALNLNLAAVSGILANIQFESGFDPNKIGDDGLAYGICQWRGARLDQMVAYCDANGLNPITLEGQLAFLAHDLQENYIYPYDLIRLCDDTPWGASDATYNFCAYYEVPADPDTESVGRVELNDILFYPTLVELLGEDDY